MWVAVRHVPVACARARWVLDGWGWPSARGRVRARCGWSRPAAEPHIEGGPAPLGRGYLPGWVGSALPGWAEHTPLRMGPVRTEKIQTWAGWAGPDPSGTGWAQLIGSEGRQPVGADRHRLIGVSGSPLGRAEQGSPRPGWTGRGSPSRCGARPTRRAGSGAPILCGRAVGTAAARPGRRVRGPARSACTSPVRTARTGPGRVGVYRARLGRRPHGASQPARAHRAPTPSQPAQAHRAPTRPAPP